MKILYITLIVFAILIFVGWLGFKIQSAPFPNHAERTPALKAIPLPKDLPAPVERFYKTVYGDEIPVIETVVLKSSRIKSATVQMKFALSVKLFAMNDPVRGWKNACDLRRQCC